MEQKIYISLKEAEELVFNKILVLPDYRLQVERAKKDWSIALFTDRDANVAYSNHLIITAGAVDKYEIPKKEESLFLNHFKVPKGFITAVDRKFRDSKGNNNPIKFDCQIDLPKEIKLFRSIRRGLIQCYNVAINNLISESFSTEVYELLNNFNRLSTLNLNFITEVVLNDFYPIKERIDGNFYPDSIKRFNWFGYYLINMHTKQHDFNEDDKNEIRAWLIKLKDKSDAATIKQTIKNPPIIFLNDYEFILGYYFAAFFYEEANIGEDYYQEIKNILSCFDLEKNHKVLFWSIFFQSVFKDELDFLYFIFSIQKQQLSIERNIIKTFHSTIDIPIVAIKRPEISKEQGIVEYLQMMDGETLLKPTFIAENEEKELLNNNISCDKISKYGFEKHIDQAIQFVPPNRCYIGENSFSLNLQEKPSDVTFYLENNSNASTWLKELKIKTKPLSKLIDKHKKVLVGFVKLESYEKSLFKLYESIVSDSKASPIFKENVFVILVDEESEKIQSVEFKNKIDEKERYYKKVFGTNSTVLIRNLRNKSDVEIKRNLKHLLKNVHIKDIELVDENLNDIYLGWISGVKREFIVTSDYTRYYSIINH